MKVSLVVLIRISFANCHHSIIVKKVQSIKVTLDSKTLNKSVYENRNQMPIVDSLLQTIFQTFGSNAPNDTVYHSR